ncbi:hypothetical protein MHU86_18309 [Fragilaria crotonensis]|nr:hypothetical protein MHU86_18309 [Fragilaria crotonensis]
MDWAINKFKTRKESEQWSQRTTEEETIIALQAQVNTLMSQKKPNPTGRPNASGKKDFKQENNKRGKGKGRPRMDIQPKWMSVPPKNGEKHHSKTVEGKDYYWCPNHNRWTRHRPSECKGIGFKAPTSESTIW